MENFKEEDILINRKIIEENEMRWKVIMIDVRKRHRKWKISNLFKDFQN
jgi:hypothetical protein